MTIREFTAKVQKTYLDEENTDLINWNKILKEGGYYHVQAGGGKAIKNWSECHAWCIKNFGKEHYTWTGSQFWFETEQDAMLFVLKWI